MTIKVPIVPVPKWDDKPLFGYYEELNGYMMIIDKKNDYKNVKLVMKAISNALEKEIIKKTGIKPIVEFKICKYKG